MSESSANDPPSSEPRNVQDAIRARAMYTIERDRAVRKRSPRQLVMAAILMVIALLGFLFAADLGVRTTHRIIELWLRIREQSQQPDVRQAYPVIVVPAAPEDSSSSRSAAQ